MKWLAVAVVVAACHEHPATPPIQPPPPADAAIETTGALPAPGLRLPRDVVPTAYDLALELDPETSVFRGHVSIHAHVAVATDHVWLHAFELAIEHATIDGAPMDAVDATDPAAAATAQMHAFRFPRAIAAGRDVVLAFDYTGKTTGDEEGLFRQQAAARWYLYTQSESVFARRVLPCFDEPSFKTPWRVTLTVPQGLVALANASESASRVLADGRREVAFAETAPMPSYLLAVAVGPFELVDGGTVGRAHIPLLVAVPAGQGARAKVAVAWTGKLVAGLEAFFDEPIPATKLDLVAVPRFFGAMENPGLITFASSILLGDPTSAPFVNHYLSIAAHELAHQWLGDDVTFAWWNDLWLSEAFATWLGDKVVAEVGGIDDAALHAASGRARALAADDEPDAKPLRRAVERTEDPESEFDAISYEKGAAVLAMFERWIGDDKLRAAVRAYAHDHRRGTATTEDLLAALAVQSPEAARALSSYVEIAGTPVVELELRCDGGSTPRVAASVRGSGSRVSVPVCIRYAARGGSAETCALADGKAEIVLREAAACPAWVTGNAGGAGYYEVVWNSIGVGPMAPVASQTPSERLVRGADLAAAVVRGEVAVTAGLAELRRLADSKDAYAELAALAIARAIEPFVDDAMLPRWWDYLTSTFADRLGPAAMLEPKTPAAKELRDQLVEMLPGDRFPAATVRKARAELDRALAGLSTAKAMGAERAERLVMLAAIAGASGGAKLYGTIEELALGTPDDEIRVALLECLGQFGPELADRTIGLVLGGKLPSVLAWPAVQGYLDRATTRGAAWKAFAPHVHDVLAVLQPSDAPDVIEVASGLCDAGSRALAAKALEPEVGAIEDGRRALDHALATIDRCIARRARAGDVANALRR